MWRACTVVMALLMGAQTPPASQPASRPATQPQRAEGDPKAIEIADSVMERMGGKHAWDRTRYLTWSFFGYRRHLWDRHTGNIRIEGRSRAGEQFVILMNLQTGGGSVWLDGELVTDPDDLRSWLDRGEAWWINDSYWLVMPYKLRDPGVTLTYVGEHPTEAGTPADVLELTFADVGRTPQNKYRVYVGRGSGLVEQWDFYEEREDEEPEFKVAWRGWTRHGRILLSGDRGEIRGNPAKLTEIAVLDGLPESLFTSSDAVDWSELISRAER